MKFISASTSCVMPFSLAIAYDDTVWGWGYYVPNKEKGSLVSTKVPLQIPDLSGIVQISANGSACLALKSDGSIYGFGNNNGGQLGNGSTSKGVLPVQVKNLNLGSTALPVSPASFKVTGVWERKHPF